VEPLVKFGQIIIGNSQGVDFGDGRERGTWLISDSNGSGYTNEVLDDGARLVLMGHDARRNPRSPIDPREIDQPEFLADGRPTENGKFLRALANGEERIVDVYLKRTKGYWAHLGEYAIIGVEQGRSSGRLVFRFLAKRY